MSKNKEATTVNYGSFIMEAAGDASFDATKMQYRTFLFRRHRSERELFYSDDAVPVLRTIDAILRTIYDGRNCQMNSCIGHVLSLFRAKLCHYEVYLFLHFLG